MTDLELERALDDDALAEMHHDELAAMVNRLYARLGEAPLSPSALDASTSDELRERVRSIRRRLTATAGQGDPARARTEDASASERRDRARGEGNAGVRRPFCVLRTEGEALRKRARSIMTRQGIPLLVADSAARLASVLASVIPTDLVIEHRTDERAALIEAIGAPPAGVRVQWTTGESTTVAALHAIAASWRGR